MHERPPSFSLLSPTTFDPSLSSKIISSLSLSTSIVTIYIIELVMRSHSSSLDIHNLSRLGFFHCQKRLCISRRSRITFESRRFGFKCDKLYCSNVQKYGSTLRQNAFQIRSMDEDFAGVSFLDDWGDNEATYSSMPSCSEGEDSDGEIILNPITDVDLPSFKEKFVSSNDALTVTAHRLATIGHQRNRHRIKSGVFINMGLITFLTMLLLLVDWCSWKIVRLPLAPFYLTYPFFISAVLASVAGYICVPILRSLKIYQVFKKEGPLRHSFKKRTATMGGLFFIPVGLIVAEVLVGFSSIEISGAAIATVAFAAVGFLDDILSLMKNSNNGLSAQIKIFLELAVGMWFSFWLETTSITSPYGMKMLVPLPSPLGVMYLGKIYLLLTPFCFVSMGNGVNLADGLDGLAGGIAALAFAGMSIAVLPICSDLAIFGASMAGACVGFLLHNRYKASVFMGDTGSLALGGALASMAACTGMFFPLYVSSGIFILEALSVVMQVSYFKTTKQLLGTGRRLFRMAPFHHHLQLCGFKEPVIVATAYVMSSMLAVFAGYVGLISV